MNEEEKIKTDETAIVEIPQSKFPQQITSQADLERAIEFETAQIRYFDWKKMKALKEILKPQDFDNFGGKPRLNGTGAQRCLIPLQISHENEHRIPEVGFNILKKDEEAIWEVRWQSTFWLSAFPQIRVIGEGARNTHSKFYSKRKNKDGSEYYLDVFEQELLDLDRAARTAMYADGISKLLGLNNLTWDDLKQYGFAQAKEIEFKKGKTIDEEAKTTTYIQKDSDIYRQIVNICKVISSYTEENPEDIMANHNLKNKRNPANLTQKEANVVLNKLENTLEQFSKKEPKSETLDEIPF